MGRRARVAVMTALFLLALVPSAGRPAAAALRYDGPIEASEVLRTMPALSGGSLSTIAGGIPVLTSAPVAAGRHFDFVGVHWRAGGSDDAIVLELRVSADGAAWGPWQPVHPDEDMRTPLSDERYASPIGVGDATHAQYRAFFADARLEDLATVSLTFIDASGLATPPLERLVRDVRAAFADWGRSYGEAASAMPKIMSRQEWGADESLMKWRPQYHAASKAVVHHTAGSDGGSNIPASIRAIYYYHAVTLGWGDIGYSYLVDRNGTIWTGRAGGDNAIAGHAYGWNEGSMGIAAMGEFTAVQPSPAMLNAIAALIAMKFAQAGLQPFGAGPFTHRERRSDGAWIPVTTTVPNVLGHRDCNYVVGQSGGQTACPGGLLYANLPNIRTQAQRDLEAGYDRLVRIEPDLPRGASPGGLLPVPILVTNRGLQPIPAGTSVSYRILRDGSPVVPQGAAVTLPGAVPPGGTTAVTVPLTVPAAGQYVVRWDLQTAGGWWNTLYATPPRDQWLRAADWSADWIDDTIPPTFTAGATTTVEATVVNDGGSTWSASGTNPVRVAYQWKNAATGAVVTVPGYARTPLAADVRSGAQVKVTVAVIAPAAPGSYILTLDLEKENEFRFGDRGVVPDDTSIAVLPDYKATYNIGGASFTAGATAFVPVTVTNTGRGAFAASAISLGYHWAAADGTYAVWDGQRTRLAADLAAGQAVTLQAQVAAPAAAGSYQLRFDLVHEGVSWFSEKGVATGNLNVGLGGAPSTGAPATPAPPGTTPIPTPSPTPAPSPAQRIYGATYAPAPSALAVVGALGAVALAVTNTGNFTWPAGGANPVALAYHWVDAGGAVVLWDGARTRLAADVAPGASVQLQATLRYPAAGGAYTLKWDLVEEGVSWFSGKGVPTRDQNVAVNGAPVYAAAYDLGSVPGSLPASVKSTVPVVVYNGSDFPWSAASGVNLSYHWYDSSGSVVVWEGARTPISVAPGTAVQVNATIVAPAAGTYTLKFDLVQEGVTWFSGRGVSAPARLVNVAAAQYGATYTPGAPLQLRAGTTAVVPLTVSNSGSLVWRPSEGYALSYHVYRSDGTVAQWDGIRTALPKDVAAGETVVVFASVRAPGPGSFIIKFDLVREGVSWFSDQGVPPSEVVAQVN